VDDHYRRRDNAATVTSSPDGVPGRPGDQSQSPVSRAIVREAYRTVQAFFRRRIADEHTAHDLTQTTFLRFRTWQKGNPGLMPDNLEAFLLRQAEWLRRDHFRKIAKIRVSETLGGDPSDLEALEDAKLLAAWAPRESAVPERVDVGCAVAMLPADKRLALVLRFVDDLPTEQIAEVLAVSRRRVNQMIQEALDELARSAPLSGYGTREGGHR
jgi:RNA polymerase sigma factor (sigma-70 family)